jgi:hypothetical protein
LRVGTKGVAAVPSLRGCSIARLPQRCAHAEEVRLAALRKTADALGLSIPLELLVAADEIIE